MSILQMLLASTPAGSASGIDISATGGLISEYEVDKI
jgi:hypothetical protein